jgi:hypothetical protein
MRRTQRAVSEEPPAMALQPQRSKAELSLFILD